MRVALVSYDFAEYCLRLAGALADHAEVLLVLPEQLVAPHRQLLDPRVRFAPFRKPRLHQAMGQLAVLRHHLATLERFAPDVVHLQQGHLWFNLTLPLLRRPALVLTAHDPRHHLGDHESRRTPQWLLDAGFRRADQLIAHGRHSRRLLIERCRVGSDRVQIIPHVTIGLEGARPEASDDGRTVLFFGRIWAYKGLEYLIRAEPLVTAARPDVRFVIAGQGESFARYRALMVHPDRFVVRNAFIPPAEVPALFAQASLVVLPYVDATQSGVVLQAYAHGKPVVATEVGDLPDIVDDEQTGLLIPPRDERALAQAILRLLADPALRRRLGAGARAKAMTTCSPATVAAQTVQVYQRALATRRTAGVPRAVGDAPGHAAHPTDPVPPAAPQPPAWRGGRR